MMDFLKEYPSVTKEAYLWEWTVPQIKIASYDKTHVLYLTEKEAEMRKAKKYSGDDLKSLNDLGLVIFDSDNE